MVGSGNTKRRERVLSALEQYEGALMRFAARMLGDGGAAEDVVQHAFLQLCRQDDEEFPKDPKPWLFKVCRNRALDLLRQSARNSQTSEATDLLLSNSAQDPVTLVERQDLSDWLQSLVNQLPPSQREAIILWCQGFSNVQIAEITDRSEGSVRVKVHRGLVRLRQHPSVQALLNVEPSNSSGVRVAGINKRTVANDESLSHKDRVS